MRRLPYRRRDELDHAGQEVWDSIVGSRGASLVSFLLNAFDVALPPGATPRWDHQTGEDHL